MQDRRGFFKALAGIREENPPQTPSITLNYASCLAWHKTMCYSCKDACFENAIVFQGLFKPVVLEERCTFCGDCAPVCPVGAIRVHQGVKEEPCESSS